VGIACSVLQPWISTPRSLELVAVAPLNCTQVAHGSRLEVCTTNASAFKTQEITGILKQYGACLMYVYFRLRTAHCLHKRNQGLWSVLVVAATHRPVHRCNWVAFCDPATQ